MPRHGFRHGSRHSFRHGFVQPSGGDRNAVVAAAKTSAAPPPRWLPLVRAGVALVLGAGVVRAAMALGVALPLSRPDNLLTAGMFGFAMGLPLLFWAVGATASMRLALGVMLSGATLVTAILFAARALPAVAA